jgi:four helix bundle protein
LRLAAVSIASNIVEGAARNSLAEYLRFLDMGYGSAKEVEYQLSIAQRLGYAEPQVLDELANQSSETPNVLNGLIRGLRKKHDSDLRTTSDTHSLIPERSSRLGSVNSSRLSSARA